MSTLRGRFDGGTHGDMERYGSSIAVDLGMLDEDIEGYEIGVQFDQPIDIRKMLGAA